MTRRINIRGVIINDKGELFCQLLTARQRDGRDFWCTPGGGLEPGESLLDGLRREMLEETGVAPEIGKLLFVQQFTEPGEPTPDRPSEQLEFFFHITNWQDYQTVQLEATSHGVSEVMQCGFVSPVTTVILPRYLTEVDLGWLTDPATPTQILSKLTS